MSVFSPATMIIPLLVVENFLALFSQNIPYGIELILIESFCAFALLEKSRVINNET
jgi:hypothetical protein